MDLFGFIDSMFDKEKYAIVSDSLKKKHFFMVQRYMSIKYPDQANIFNKNGINQVVVMDFWASFLSRNYTKKPQWMFTPTNKSEKQANVFGKIKSETIDFYLDLKRMDLRDFNFMKSIYPEDLLAELTNLEKALKEDNII